jgi:hypothetical protein
LKEKIIPLEFKEEMKEMDSQQIQNEQVLKRGGIFSTCIREFFLGLILICLIFGRCNLERNSFQVKELEIPSEVNKAEISRELIEIEIQKEVKEIQIFKIRASQDSFLSHSANCLTKKKRDISYKDSYWRSSDVSIQFVFIHLFKSSDIQTLRLQSAQYGVPKTINVYVLPFPDTEITASSFADRINMENISYQVQNFTLRNQIRGSFIIMEIVGSYPDSKYYTLNSISVFGYDEPINYA